MRVGRLMESEQSLASLKAHAHAKLLLVSERLEGLVGREAKQAARRGESSVSHDWAHRPHCRSQAWSTKLPPVSVFNLQGAGLLHLRGW